MAGDEASGNAIKGKLFLTKLHALSQSPEGKTANVVVREVMLTRSLTQLSKVSDPKKAAVFVTAVMVQKAMAAAGLTTKEETIECLKAVSNLAGDFATAALLGPATLGIGALLPLALAAVDSYEVGKACFNTPSGVAHAVSVSPRSVLKSALKTTIHGPI
jgi:hypothetical protein